VPPPQSSTRTTPEDADSSPRADAASVRLRRKIDLVDGPFFAACGRLFTHPRIVDLLPPYLVRTHSIIRATEALMEAARDRARALAEADPVAAGVAAYLAKHVEEERDHDDWLLEDLQVLGLDGSEVLARVPSPTVARLVGQQYYWALHYHPVALLGYFAFMEGNPPKASFIEDLIVKTGYPREAFRTLFEHGELDQHHRDELDRTIDSLPLSREHEIVLGLSAMTTVELVTRSIEEVLEEVPDLR
jgi:heme oxygenase-like protein